MSAEDTVAVALRIADALARDRVPYAIGGALAYGYWGVGRATKDVDINLFVTSEQLTSAFDALDAAGVEIDRQQALASATVRGDAVGWVGQVRIDLFVNSIPLHDQAAQRTVEVILEGQPIRILSAEDIAVLKFLFFRGKDIVDLERLFAMRADLDLEYIERWLVDAVGKDDARVTKFHALVGPARLRDDAS